MDIFVSLSAATLCFISNGIYSCYPVLTGATTPKGEFPIVRLYTDDPGYGGDVLKFDENDELVFAIHRVWLLNPKQRRLQRLQSTNVRDRQNITNGCLNIDNSVYDKLLDACKYGCKLSVTD